jgi:glucose-6-phosphate isomerase
MANARSARAWFLDQGGTDIARHFVATTTNVEARPPSASPPPSASGTGWAGAIRCGRAIGLPIAIAIGQRALPRAAGRRPCHGPALCRGAAGANLPVLLGLLDVWYRNFHRLHQPLRGALPPGPARLPAYLQQLEMESNGKRVDLHGQPLPYGTSPVVWGEPGTNGQHAYFQMLHQGTDVVPVEFIAVKPDAHVAWRTCTPSCWPTAWRRARR